MDHMLDYIKSGKLCKAKLYKQTCIHNAIKLTHKIKQPFHEDIQTCSFKHFQHEREDQITEFQDIMTRKILS